MTTSVTAAGRPAPGATAVEWLTQWVKDHKRAAAYIAAVLAIAAALFVWNLLSTRTAERSAGRQLEQGRLALASRNYQRSEEHTSELQSPCNLVCRLLLEKKKKKQLTSLHST